MPPKSNKELRAEDLARIVSSVSPRKVVVAGPGTGKSFLFGELIKSAKKAGKTRFLAITFIGKLGDALADDLCGLAETTTMHSFARGLFLKHYKNWTYYPTICDVIAEDLKNAGTKSFTIGDENYRERSKHYLSVGNDDVVLYALRICQQKPERFPAFDLVLVDEYQDFNEIESEFVDWIATRTNVVIVGDDDQALYQFKGSSPSFIRTKHHSANTDWESHSLRFCSRCTAVIVKYFHALVDRFKLNDTKGSVALDRIQKEYNCYLLADDGSKDRDSAANPRIEVITQCPPGMIAHRIELALKDLVQRQKVKDVLVIGEARSCKSTLATIAAQLTSRGFRSVAGPQSAPDVSIRQAVFDAYGKLAKDDSSTLGWRLLGDPTDGAERKRHVANAATFNVLRTGTPSARETLPAKKLRALDDALIEPSQAEKDGAKREEVNEELRQVIIGRAVRKEAGYLPRPLANIDITVCNILQSKGLGADAVFVVGFDEGKFPTKADATEGEVYQMLVAVTRAKKRLFLINTVGKNLSQFAEALAPEDREYVTIGG